MDFSQQKNSRRRLPTHKTATEAMAATDKAKQQALKTRVNDWVNEVQSLNETDLAARTVVPTLLYKPCRSTAWIEVDQIHVSGLQSGQPISEDELGVCYVFRCRWCGEVFPKSTASSPTQIKSHLCHCSKRNLCDLNYSLNNKARLYKIEHTEKSKVAMSNEENESIDEEQGSEERATSKYPPTEGTVVRDSSNNKEATISVAAFFDLFRRIPPIMMSCAKFYPELSDWMTSNFSARPDPLWVVNSVLLKLSNRLVKEIVSITKDFEDMSFQIFAIDNLIVVDGIHITEQFNLVKIRLSVVDRSRGEDLSDALRKALLVSHLEAKDVTFVTLSGFEEDTLPYLKAFGLGETPQSKCIYRGLDHYLMKSLSDLEKIFTDDRISDKSTLRDKNGEPLSLKKLFGRIFPSTWQQSVETVYDTIEKAEASHETEGNVMYSDDEIVILSGIKHYVGWIYTAKRRLQKYAIPSIPHGIYCVCDVASKLDKHQENPFEPDKIRLRKKSKQEHQEMKKVPKDEVLKPSAGSNFREEYSIISDVSFFGPPIISSHQKSDDSNTRFFGDLHTEFLTKLKQNLVVFGDFSSEDCSLLWTAPLDTVFHVLDFPGLTNHKDKIIEALASTVAVPDCSSVEDDQVLEIAQGVRLSNDPCQFIRSFLLSVSMNVKDNGAITNPVEWWAKNKHYFEDLARLARKWLSAHITIKTEDIVIPKGAKCSIGLAEYLFFLGNDHIIARISDDLDSLATSDPDSQGMYSDLIAKPLSEPQLSVTKSSEDHRPMTSTFGGLPELPPAILKCLNEFANIVVQSYRTDQLYCLTQDECVNTATEAGLNPSAVYEYVTGLDSVKEAISFQQTTLVKQPSGRMTISVGSEHDTLAPLQKGYLDKFVNDMVAKCMGDESYTLKEMDCQETATYCGLTCSQVYKYAKKFPFFAEEEFDLQKSNDEWANKQTHEMGTATDTGTRSAASSRATGVDDTSFVPNDKSVETINLNDDTPTTTSVAYSLESMGSKKVAEKFNRLDNVLPNEETEAASQHMQVDNPPKESSIVSNNSQPEQLLATPVEDGARLGGDGAKPTGDGAKPTGDGAEPPGGGTN